MALNNRNSDIDSANIIRQPSVRASKDKAIARIAIPFEDMYGPKKTVSRSKSFAVKKVNQAVDEIEHKMRTRLSISFNEEEDDDDEDENFGSGSDSKDSESSNSSDNDVSDEDMPTTNVTSIGVTRRKTVAGFRKSTAQSNTFDKCVKKTERTKITAKSFADEIPCRDVEFDQIYLSISTLICNGDGGCIFVVGVPGTGKTATVTAVIDCLEAEEAKLPDFNRVSINGMHVTEVREVYSLIYKELTDKKVSKNRAVACLENELLKKSRTKKSTVILIDEIDQLHTKKEDVLYKIFGWTQRRESRLIIVAIANTMDLPERLTQNKVTSRSGVTRFIFQPYNHEQLLTILWTKLNQHGTTENVDPKALEFAARKVAAASGDVRRILEIFRRIFQLQKAGKKIDISLVDFILKEMFAQPKIAALRDNCSFYEKMFLKALVATFKRSGLEESKLKEVVGQMRDMCVIERVRMPNNSEILTLLISLGSYKLVLHDSLMNNINVKIRLNCSQENVNFALNNN